MKTNALDSAVYYSGGREGKKEKQSAEKCYHCQTYQLTAIIKRQNASSVVKKAT